jgi:hypothetical protein
MNKKTMVEDALFQIQNLEEALNKNAEEILASTMKEEIKSLVKESQIKEQGDDEVEDDDFEDDEDVVMLDDPDDEMGDIPMAPVGDFDDEDDFGDEDDFEDDETIDLTKASDAEVIKVFKLMGDEDGIVVTKDEDSISIVDGEDEYLVKLNEEITNEMEHSNYELDEDVFGKFGDDESGDEEFSFDDEEFGDEKEFGDEEFSFGGDKEEVLYELEMDEDDHGAFNPDDTIDEDAYGDELEEVLYELEMDEDAYGDELEEDDFEFEEGMSLREGKKSRGSKVSRKGRTGKGPGKFSYKKDNVFYKKPKKMKEGPKKPKTSGKPVKYSWKEEVNMEGFTKKAEFKEGSRTNNSVTSNLTGRRKGGSNRNESRRKVRKESIDNEVNLLREKNGEYKKALDMFRTKLNEVAIFNSNLAYATRLFTEHSTTKQEKINILRRFDNVETLKESKNLYRSIKNELSNEGLMESTQINETIERVVSKTPSTGSATNLIESKTYENPQFLRMKDLMTKIK